jgi:small subunit ribosomal protein S7
MYDGKRGAAEKALYTALTSVEAKTGKNGLEVLETALKNIMPTLEVKARRVGGANYQVPIEVRADRRETLGIRWLVTNARRRGEKSMEVRLAGEIMDAANNTGAAVKRKEDTHRMAEANRAFAHYRW